MADSPKRSGSLERVRAYLTEHLLDDQIIEFETPTKTAQQAADAAGCELGQIVKSLVFVVDDRPVLVLVAGDRRGDAEAIAQLMGGTVARFADAETVRRATGFAIGGVSPFALPKELPVLVDDSLERFETVYPAAGTPSSMVKMRRTDLLDLSGGRVARVSL
jgi:Cys-tRNA(Pro) deacylase